MPKYKDYRHDNQESFFLNQSRLAIFTANAMDMAAFLITAMDSISSARHELSASEKSGFCLCMAALKQNICGAHEADMILQQAEASNA